MTGSRKKSCRRPEKGKKYINKKCQTQMERERERKREKIQMERKMQTDYANTHGLFD